MRSASEKSVLVPQNIVSRVKTIALIIETMLSTTENIVGTLKNIVSAFEKIVSMLENILSTSQNIVGGTQNIVEIDRCRMYRVVKDLMIVAKHCLRVGDHPKTYLSKHLPELTPSTSSTPQA